MTLLIICAAILNRVFSVEDNISLAPRGRIYYDDDKGQRGNVDR
jgi:hypothetical protein